MGRVNKEDILFNKVQRMASKDLNLITVLRLFNIFIKLTLDDGKKYIRVFIREYYSLEEEMPDEFYELILTHIHGNDPLTIFNIFTKKDIYILISYLKHNQEVIDGLEDAITPQQYYLIPKRYIKKIIEMLKQLEQESTDNSLSNILQDELLWKLKMLPHINEMEYLVIAYKIYISIGLDNGLELLAQKYGAIDYEKVHFMFFRMNVKDSINDDDHNTFNRFLFDNKKDINNVMRQVLSGEFKELFLNFDYFYNNFSYFRNKLGTKMTKGKVKSLLEERFLSRNVVMPEITGDILEDMVSSYYSKYELLGIPEQEIQQKNFQIYEEFLRKKYKSSIPTLGVMNKGIFSCEVLKLSDPRNLVLGYRAGNCFRINGEAAILFRKFLQSEHMRLLSISTDDYKDFAMVLIMRNGNVLIGQGIEVSKWAPPDIKGKKLYDVCREVLYELMDYMNASGDEIVATVMGCSNQNVSDYNQQILPFLIGPILENSDHYYNGIYNYQCLLDMKEGKSLSDIKLSTPLAHYLDEREPILRRMGHIYDNNYREIEKRLRVLRYFRMCDTHSVDFYLKLYGHKEVYTCCNKDWYLMLFDDGEIDGFILDGDERAKGEYDCELAKIKQEQKKKIKSRFKKKVE